MKMAHLFQEKLLDAHPEKTGFIVFCGEEYKRDVDKQLALNPLYLGVNPVKVNILGKFYIQVG